MTDILEKITEKKQKLDTYQPLPEAMIKNLDEWYRVELTYTSNAIEGNTLSRAETALVVEKGITVEGKSITEHLEAINHAQAVDFIKQTLIPKKRTEVTEQDILAIHKIILQKIDDRYAGRYRDVPVRIAGSTVILPNYMKVPILMHEFTSWIQSAKGSIVTIAAEAHLRFESIHPFVDGNGRVGRLLMNVLLMQEGYPPVIIRKEDRRQYITSLEKAQTTNNTDDYFQFMYESIDKSLDIYLQSIERK